MAFLAGVAGCRDYGTRDDGTASDAAAAAAAVADSCLPPTRWAELALHAVRYRLPQSAERMRRWKSDPEGHYHMEDGRTSDDDQDGSVAALSLYLAVAEGGRAGKGAAAAAAEVLSLVARAMADLEGQKEAVLWEGEGKRERGSGGAAAVLRWDALYTAAGTSLLALEKGGGGFAFGPYAEGFLLPALEALVLERPQQTALVTPAPGSTPVLRRRIVWLLAANFFFVPRGCRARFYRALLAIVVDEDRSSQNDLCVKLTAVQALSSSLFEGDEGMAIFRDHGDAVIAALYRLAGECEEYESRTLILSSVSLILTYLLGCGTITDRTANAAVEPLVQIWSNAVDQNALLRRDVLSILSSLAQAVGTDGSARMHPIALPMIGAAIDPALRKDNVFLAEDALGLWLALLRLAPSYTDDLGSVYHRAKDLLAQDYEHLKVLMIITEGYVLLGGAAFLNCHSATLQSILVLVVGHVRPRGVAYIMLVLEALLRTYPTEGGQLLARSGVLKTMLEACSSTHYGIDGSDPDRVTNLYLTTLARCILASPNILDAHFPRDDERRQGSFGPNDLIHLFWKLFNYEGSGTFDLLRRKIWLLAMISLFPPTESQFAESILKGLDQILDECLQIMRQENETRSNLVPYEVEIDYEYEEEACEAGQERHDSLLGSEHEKDVARMLDIRIELQARLEGLAAATEASYYHDILSTVEPVTLKQLENAMK